MRISISSGTLFTFPLQKAFQMASEAGFDGVELIINQDFQRVNSRKLLAELAEITPILSIHAPFMPLDGWGGPIDSLRRSVELAAEAGIRLVNFHPPSWLGCELGFWRWLYRVHDFQKEVGNGTVLITLENMPWTGRFKTNQYILSQTDKMIDFINDFYLFYGTGRIRNIHFSDYGHGREHLLPGHGILPLTRFLNHLRNTGYSETLTLELSPHEFPRDERFIVDSLKEILHYLRRETAGEGRGILEHI